MRNNLSLIGKFLRLRRSARAFIIKHNVTKKCSVLIKDCNMSLDFIVTIVCPINLDVSVYIGLYIVIYVEVVDNVAGIRHNSTIILRATRTCTGIGKKELILVEYVTLRHVDGQSAVIGWT
ncbi:hypothetical protein J6590_088841 [Homalodisca vitripennis]|nr:hypothetical protein J6590_088841 [Homalodisca vitripennis]